MFYHSLKSSSANVGAMELSKISRVLELECKEKGIEHFDRHIEAIESVFIRARGALEKEIS